MRDIIIIGAGPAGISAALYAKARGMDCLVLEKEKVGGLIGKVSKVSHYTGIVQGEDGPSFRKKMEEQLKNAAIEIRYEEVKSLDLERKEIRTNKREYQTKAIILAMGSRPKDLGIEHEDQVKHETIPWAEEVKNHTVFVAGGSDGAAKEAIYLSQFAEKVYMVQIADEVMMIDEFRQIIEEKDNIEILLQSEIKELQRTDDRIQSVGIYNHKEDHLYQYRCDNIYVFSYIGQKPNTELLPKELLEENGYVKSEITTAIPGVFSCGDILEKAVRQVSTAVNDGTIAGILSAKYVKTL